jgi:hypothetical protein
VYLGSERDELVNTDFVLSQFDNNRNKALRFYNEFISEPMDKGDIKNLNDVVDKQFLGGSDFIIEAQGKMGEDRVGKGWVIANKRIDELWGAVKKLTGFGMTDLSGRKRGKGLVEARSLFIHLCARYTTLKRKEIARLLDRDAGSLTKIEMRITSLKLNAYLKKLGW